MIVHTSDDVAFSHAKGQLRFHELYQKWVAQVSTDRQLSSSQSCSRLLLGRAFNQVEALMMITLSLSVLAKQCNSPLSSIEMNLNLRNF